MIAQMSHIGIVVNNIEEATKLWVETYGLKVSHRGEAEVEGIKHVFLAVGNNFIELMEPINHQDMSNAIAKRLATRGEGIYHIAFVVDDIDEESKILAGKGVTLIKRPPSPDQPRGRWIIHPKSANGAMLELLS